MVIQMQLACTPADQIDLKYPALYVVAQRVTLTLLGETVNLAIPEYTTVCTQTDPTIISFQIAGFGPPAWISVTNSSNFQVAPTDAIFEQFADTLVQVTIVASNSDGSIPNTDVTIELEFPSMPDLYCPLTSLELADPTSDTFTFTLSDKTEVFYAPLVKDSASIEKLADPTGLIGCGDRQYSVISSSDNNYIDIDSVTQSLTLKDSVTISDVGEHQLVVKVMLNDYPQVTKLLTLKIKIQVMSENGLDGQIIEPIFDPECQVKSLTLMSFSTSQTLQSVIQLTQDFPLLLQFKVPFVGPLPFCGYTFQDVVYSLTDSRKQPYSKDSWLSYNKADHEIVIDISSAEVAPKQIRSVCILAKLSQKGIEKLTCFKIVPFGLDPESIIDGLVVEPDDVDKVKEDQLDSDTKVDTDQTSTELFVNEKALHAQQMKELKKSFATEIGSRELSDETLTFKIESVSATGKVTLKFSEPVFTFSTLSNRTIDIDYCSDKNCDNLSNEPQKKLWVEVDIVAGESSDTAKLGFNSTMSFTDSETLTIELKFDSTLDVSLFSDEDKIRVKLWGPFVSSSTLAPISQENRVATRALPPQLKDDWAGQALSFIVDEDVMTTVTWSGIITSTARNLFVRGSLSNVFGMITGMQLIVHSPLINVQFPSNAFILYEELIHVATYEILPTSDIFPLFMDMPERGFLNEKFERLDYGSFYSTVILGSVFILFLWLLSLIPIYYLLRLCRLRFMWPERMIQYLHGFLFWKQFLVFTYASFIEIVICILLQSKIVEFPWLETFWVFVSFLLWICLIVQVIYIICVSLFIVLPRMSQFETSQYLQRKYGFLVSNIDTKKGGLAMCFNLNYYVRRIALAIAAIYLEDFPACQIFILIFVDTLAMIMQGLVEPANTKSANRLALYDDLTLLLIIECLLCCTDFVSDAYGRYCVGYAIIFLTLQNLGVNLVILFATPVHSLILWLKRCYTIRQKTKGQTIKYAKQQAKRSLQMKLAGLKNLVSNSRSQMQSQNMARSQTLHEIEEIDEDEFNSEEEKKSVILPQIQMQKENSDSSESSDSQQSEENDKCNFSIHSNRLDEQNSLRGLKESQRTEDSTARNIILTKKQPNDSFQSPEQLKVKFEKSPKSGKMAPGKEHLMNKLMTVEYIDQSSTHRGSSHPDAQILSPNKRRSSYQKHQNFSQMIQVSKPIGASVEDVVHLDSAQRIRNAQVKKGNSIYLGENEKSNSMMTASQEQLEAQMFSPSSLVADIVRINNGFSNKKQQVPKLNFDTPVSFNIGVDNFKIDSQSCLSNYSGKKQNVTPRDSISSHASHGEQLPISPQKRHSSLLVVGSESRSARAQSDNSSLQESPQNNSKDKRNSSVDLLSVSGSKLSNYKAKRPPKVEPFKFQSSSVLGDSFSVQNMSQDNRSQQDSNCHLSVADNHRIVQFSSTVQAFNIDDQANCSERFARKKIMYATTLNNLGPVTELMSPIKEEMSPEKKRKCAALSSQSASKQIQPSDRLIQKAAKPSRLMKQAAMAGFSQSKISEKNLDVKLKGMMHNSEEKYRENPSSIGNISLQFADEKCEDNALNLSPQEKQSQMTLHHLGPTKLRLSPRSMHRRQSDSKAKKAGTNTMELPNLGFDQMLKAYDQSSNMSKVSANKEESVQQCFNIAINEPDQEPIVITPVPSEKKKFTEMKIPIHVAAMEQSGSELNLSL